MIFAATYSYTVCFIFAFRINNKVRIERKLSEMNRCGIRVGSLDHRVTLRYIFLCVWSNVTFKRTVFVASEGFVSSVIVFLFLFRVKRTLPLGCDRVWSVSQVIILLPRRLLLKRNRLQTSHHRYTHMPARKTFP